MALPIDIYTRAPISRRSSEHVLPNFLGGALEVRDLIDKSTNDRFGATIDAALDKATLPFRNILNARSHRDPSRPVPTLQNVRGMDGKKYNLSSGGLVKLIPEIRIEEKPGHIHIAAVVSDIGDVRQALRKTARRKGKDINEIIKQLEVAATPRKEPSPELTLPITIFSHDCYRAVAKIACNHFAIYGRDTFLNATFDGIRMLVLNGEGNPADFVQPIDVDISSTRIGPLDHLVSSWLDEDGQARAYVVLFGFLGFSIKLGSTADGSPPFRHTYRVDQLGRSYRKSDSADLEVRLPVFEAAFMRTYDEWRSSTLEQVQRLAKSIIRIRDQRSLEDLVDRRWAEFFGEHADCDPDDPKVIAFTNALAADVAEALLPQFQRAAEQRRRSTEHLRIDRNDKEPR